MVNNLIFEQENKFFFCEILRIIVLFIQKFVIKLSKIWVWDPGSKIWDPEKPIPDPGSMLKKARDPGSGSAALLFSIHLFFQRTKSLLASFVWESHIL
jgi:hypothetical protein